MNEHTLSELDFYPYGIEGEIVLKHKDLLFSWSNITILTDISTSLKDVEDLVSRDNSKTFYHKIEDYYPAGRLIDNKGDSSFPDIEHLIWHADKCFILEGKIESEVRLDITIVAPCIIAFDLTLVNVGKLTLSTDNLSSVVRGFIAFLDNPKGVILLKNAGLQSSPMEMLETNSNRTFVSGINFARHISLGGNAVTLASGGSLFCEELSLETISSASLHHSVQCDGEVKITSQLIFQNSSLISKGALSYKSSQLEFSSYSETFGVKGIILSSNFLQLKGKVFSDGNLKLSVQNKGYIDNGAIEVLGDIEGNFGDLRSIDSSQIVAGGNIKITGQTYLFMTSIYSNASIAFDARRLFWLHFHSSITAQREITFKSQSAKMLFDLNANVTAPITNFMNSGQIVFEEGFKVNAGSGIISVVTDILDVKANIVTKNFDVKSSGQVSFHDRSDLTASKTSIESTEYVQKGKFTITDAYRVKSSKVTFAAEIQEVKVGSLDIETIELRGVSSFSATKGDLRLKLSDWQVRDYVLHAKDKVSVDIGARDATIYYLQGDSSEIKANSFHLTGGFYVTNEAVFKLAINIALDPKSVIKVGSIIVETSQHQRIKSFTCKGCEVTTTSSSVSTIRSENLLCEVNSYTRLPVHHYMSKVYRYVGQEGGTANGYLEQHSWEGPFCSLKFTGSIHLDVAQVSVHLGLLEAQNIIFYNTHIDSKSETLTRYVIVENKLYHYIGYHKCHELNEEFALVNLADYGLSEPQCGGGLIRIAMCALEFCDLKQATINDIILQDLGNGNSKLWKAIETLPSYIGARESVSGTIRYGEANVLKVTCCSPLLYLRHKI